jgi:PAS domain S-box-containing protein
MNSQQWTPPEISWVSFMELSVNREVYCPMAAAELSTPAGSPRPQAAALLERFPHACFALDREGRFTYLNPQAEHLFGQLARGLQGPLLGRTIWDECPEMADSTFSRACQQASTEQRPVKDESFYPTLNRWFAVHICPMPDGLGVFLEDVSEETRVQKTLRQRAEELAEADRGKDEFLVQLTHEVRNALATVSGALHLTKARGLDDPEDERACALADHEVRRLSRLMDDLLKVSQLLPGHVRLQKERVPLASVVARSLAATVSGDGVGGRSLTVDLPSEPLWVEADPGQLEQVLKHLLDNAVKFSRSGGHIRLKAEREFGTIVVRIKDDGVGMSPEVLPRVFNLFMRANRGQDRFQGGMGIGLTLVRRLVELHGGSVEAHSEGPDRGSEFVVRLPAPEEGPPEPSWEAVGKNSARPLRVLVVDDNMDAAQSLSFMLGRWGYDVRVTYDGPRALEEAAAGRPDVVLLDIGMPGMDGYVVARRLREVAGNEKMVLVAVTGYGQDEDRFRALQAGFDYHLVKPVEPGEFKKLLADAGTGRQVPASSVQEMPPSSAASCS